MKEHERETMMFKTVSVILLCLAIFGGHLPDLRAVTGFSSNDDCQRTAHPAEAPVNDYQADIDLLIALRSHPLDELLALANQLEIKWRRINWDHYARVMRYVCSEISNRALKDARAREQSERFARIALSHSNMYLWEHEAALVGALGYPLSSSDSAWLRERREKAGLWLQAWQRLEKEFDPTFDINDRKNRPALRVWPPFETGLPPGTPPSAIKDPNLRAQYEAAIADNKRKSQRADQQLPLLAHGPSFKARAEHWLIGCYSLPPAKNAELKLLLEVYVHDTKARERILDEVQKNSK